MKSEFKVSVEISGTVSPVFHRGQVGAPKKEDMEKMAKELIYEELSNVIDTLTSLKGSRFSDGVVEVKITSVKAE